MVSNAYEPKAIEEKWLSIWLQKNLFRADPEAPGTPFSIVIPPPNVTGSLHMGHALNVTLQDILVRYKRMTGANVLWLPGTDHAGIATQNVVERQLAEQGLRKESLGRERFVEKVWEWKRQYGGIIIEQLKRLGASCDWSRERFTMDSGLSRAVREVFVRLFEEGLIYRGDYIINWCPRCQTALSDLEVELRETKGHLWHIRYPVAGEDDYICVATTRPETMLGDTAVAVHPEDNRYQRLLGKRVVLPLMAREIPIIADTWVDPTFGSGAVKITPAHDFNDFEIAQRHNLPLVVVMDETGHMNEQAGPYRTLGREACRNKVVEDLKAQGLLEAVEEYQHHLGHCYRCHCVVEPYLSKQWFVKTKPLAGPAIEAVRTGKIRIIPQSWEKTYFEWMYNIRDWCISRQIWWGHQIPAWVCESCEGVTVARETPSVCSHCGRSVLRQETDVLDTWFSSALWPFSTLGWPEKTRDLDVYYPTSTMVTGFDILFFWVARMIMMGLKCMGDVPFRDVYIHALVRDAEGQKMSKSKGNVIDPLVVIERYGADAFRYTLAALAAQGRDIRLSEERIQGYRHFMNKIWNLARFTFMNLQGWEPSQLVPEPSLLDQWMLTRLSDTVGNVRDALEAYKFNEAAHALYQFIWHEFCDWYVEFSKVDLYRATTHGDTMNHEDANRVRFYLHKAFGILVRLLHPFCPFVSEEIWASFARGHESLAYARFPEVHEVGAEPQAAEQAHYILDAISAIRTIRGEMNVPPAARLHARIVCASEAVRRTLSQHEAYVKALAGLRSLELLEHGVRPRQAAVSVVSGMEVFVPLEGVIDFDKEAARIQRALERVEKEMRLLAAKLSDDGFIHKAPPQVVEKDRKRYDSMLEERHKLEHNLNQLLEVRG